MTSLNQITSESSASRGEFNRNSLLLCIRFEAILFPLALPAEMLSCGAARHRPCRSSSRWQSDDPTQRFSSASIKPTRPVSAAANSLLLHPHQVGLSDGAPPVAPPPTEPLPLAASALAALTPDYCSSADQLLKDEQLEKKLVMMSESRSASTVRSYASPPKVSAIVAGLTSSADSAVKVNDGPLPMSHGQNRSSTDTK